MRPANHDHFDKPHTHSQKDGYVASEYEHQEYPKVIGKNDDGGDVIAQNADEEKAYLDEQAKAKAE